MRPWSVLMATALLAATALPAAAKIDLVTLPARDRVQLTVYNSADLTLVREERSLTLVKGINRLEFGWENTLIDPTSVQLRAPRHGAQVRLLEVAYPPGVQGSAVWTIESDVEGPVPVEISFFTSGITWRAFYMGTLSADETALRLQGYVRVENRSGEDYHRAQTRVIVGQVHLLDEIAELAARDVPYGRPSVPGLPEPLPMTLAPEALRSKAYQALSLAEDAAGAAAAVKAIVKEGLSEYFLYTIEGTEDLPDGWAKRLPSFDVTEIPVRNLYRYEEERYGPETRRLIYFRNDKTHRLGDEPLPDGQIKLYRSLDADQHLSYAGEVHSKYIPIDQEVELDLGAAREVRVEPMLMARRSDQYLFDDDGNITGFDTIQDWELRLTNNRPLPVRVEVWRNFAGPHWELANAADNTGRYEKVDLDTVKYTVELPADGRATLRYTLTERQGQRRYSR